MGPNGAGKTTLLETILGLLKPRRGTVKIFGHDMRRKAQFIRKMCSYLPQDFMKDSDEPFLAKNVVAMGIASNRDFGKLEEEDWRMIYEALELVGMLKFSKRPIGKLSGGQQQKVMLARALVRKPKLLLL
ncbi:MAG TPA: ATP-binding cassette domain-containing protein, partial [Nitrososphaeria archaeon]|nr:ATP-binding cassette domain-containing protein [Nitrososphaeria archaeon]